MGEYNASNTKHIRRVSKEARQREAERAAVIYQIMASPAGRFYFHDRLVRSHVFETSFAGDPYLTAFAEGERNIGLRDLLDIVRHCPDQYIQMMREATDREVANARRNANPAADRSGAGNGRDDSGAGDDLVERDYDPADGDDDFTGSGVEG